MYLGEFTHACKYDRMSFSVFHLPEGGCANEYADRVSQTEGKKTQTKSVKKKYRVTTAQKLCISPQQSSLTQTLPKTAAS